MITVTLCKKKKNAEKEYLFLNYSPAIFNTVTKRTYRQEYLRLFLYINPKTPQQRSHNKEAWRMGQIKRDIRAAEAMRGELGFFDESVLKKDFLAFFYKLAQTKGDSWKVTYLHFKRFMNGKCTFGNLSVQLSNHFREYLLCLTKKDGTSLSERSAAAYFCRYRCAIAEAYKSGLIKRNFNDFLDSIPYNAPRKEFLTQEEVIALSNTPCKYDVLKRAAIFSIMTGLRISDIIDLKWEDIKVAPDGGPCIVKEICKIGRDEIIYISEEALSYCGKRYQSGPVFNNLKKSWTFRPLQQWVRQAGIKRHITFHCLRHSYLSLLLKTNDLQNLNL